MNATQDPSPETAQERERDEEWERFVAESEARGVCPFSGYTFKRCQASVCDCFREQFPDHPYGLHPEAFAVLRPEGSDEHPRDRRAVR